MLIVPPNQSFTLTVDPIFYCFGAHERAAWRAGGKVLVRYGFSGAATTGPYVAVPIPGVAPELAKVKELRAAPIDVPPTPDLKITPSLPPLPRDLTVLGPALIDSARGVDVSYTTTVLNEGHAAVTTYVRPPTVGVRVVGNGGTVQCTPTAQITPIRDLFSTIGPKGRASVSFLVDAQCPEGTLDEAGIYLVFPVLDTRRASGAPYHLHTADDLFWGTEPTELRVRSGKRPPRRVTLDPTPSPGAP
jgi:hypothetical protein